MKNNERGNQIERSEVWTIAIVVPLFVLLVQVFVVAVCWDRLCAKIVLNALEYGTEQVVSRTVFDTPPPMRDQRAASKRPKPWHQLSHAEKVEKVRAGQERSAPAETVDEMLDRLDRERRDLEPQWYKDSDPYR